MSAPVIFILIGNTDYETDDIVAAYESKEAADADAAFLNDLLKARPSCSHIDGSAAAWERYHRAENRWKRKFPRPDITSCDYFSVREIGVVAATAPAEDSPCTPPPGA